MPLIPMAVLRFFLAFVYGASAIGLGYIWAAGLGIGGAALALLVVEAAMAGVVIHVYSSMARIGLVQWVKIVLRPPFDLIACANVSFWKQVSATPE